jgi:predicted DsbA family dithiol-disulfide isomerase
MSTTIKVDIWSDVACPWCYIGKRKFEAAVEQFEQAHQEYSIEVEYHSFLLNPDMPVDYEGGQSEYLSKHKGLPLAQVEDMSKRITAIAEAVGLHYDFEHQIMTNTQLAHELIHFAKTKGQQSAMKERLLAAHFVEARHVGQLDVLVQLAGEVGLDKSEAREALETRAFTEAFNQDVAIAREYGISGVPFFVINARYGVSGAQNPEAFLQAFEQVIATD